LDCAAALAGLVALSPLGLLISVAIRAEDGGPVFYAHWRVGRNFSPFRLWKFRTMVPGADRMGGPVTVANDPRVTRVGHFLRRYKLDELPQLVNVLRGEMSVVGPRPESERYVALFRAQYARILQHRPGITDPASLAFRNEEEVLAGAGDADRLYTEEILPRKLALSVAYLRNRTLFSDLKIILQTLVRVVRPLPAGELIPSGSACANHPGSPAATRQPEQNMALRRALEEENSR
jgi:lipopolysaccharide/colanic/teichoic acid biosynthesis glycosyltransferase